MSWDGAQFPGGFNVEPPNGKRRSPRKQFEKMLRREFLPYQIKWLDDTSRFKIGLWARQTGKDWSASAEAVKDCMERPGTLWAIVAAGERQALESLRKAKDWAAILHYALEGYCEKRVSKGALLNAAEIVWHNKSRLIALPARPETVRGYSANLILTEFAFHENPYPISGVQLHRLLNRESF